MNGTAPGLDQRLQWFEQGEAAVVAAVGDMDLRAPSRLPGWTRAHVVAHLIGNAAALGNLLQWAKTGIPTPMYSGPQARAEQIDRDATASDTWLSSTLIGTSHTLAEALHDMRPVDFQTTVTTAQGRQVTAAEIPWMRTRESVLHLLDLHGDDLADQPTSLIDALLDDTVRTVGGRPGCPDLTLVVDGDEDRSWVLGTGGTPVSGTGPQLLRWVIGRPAEPGDPEDWYPAGGPELPRWL